MQEHKILFLDLYYIMWHRDIESCMALVWEMVKNHQELHRDKTKAFFLQPGKRKDLISDERTNIQMSEKWYTQALSPERFHTTLHGAMFT